MNLSEILAAIKIPKYLSRSLSVIICSIGLFLQIKEVSDIYFRYSTQSKVVVLPHFTIRVPSLSACLRLADIIKLEEVNSDLKMDLVRPNMQIATWNRWVNKVSNLSIGDRLKYTPNVGEVLNSRIGCAIRFPDKDHLEYFSDKECYQYFNVTKYYHRESVCYKFTPNLGAEELLARHYLADGRILRNDLSFEVG